MGVLERVGNVTSKYVVVWVVIVAAVALHTPETFIPIGDYISVLLGVVMLGMGVTLTPDDFRRIAERPRDVLVGALAQWVVMPVLAYVLVVTLGLPWEIGVGLVLVGAAPGGTASNVMTYLGRGDIALSVTITSVTTIAAPLVMPVWIVLLAGEQITVTFAKMTQEIVLIVLIPVVAGLGLRLLLDEYAPTAAKVGLSIFPAISVIAIVAIVAAVVGLDVEEILTASAVVFLAVVLHNGLGLGAGYGVSYLTGMAKDRARACAFEVGLQNSGLGVALAVAFFDPIAALIPALFSVWHNVTGPELATAFTWNDEDPIDDYEPAIHSD
ncbi:bile acid:sodium symporter family protein [Natronobacterium gregoryi SP2]|uniref:Bile acid:sodium symporter family protein n=1 Tax=Natronobacterium gregoryi (strain ATCC 43098 / DSM 3393 / CCM 3738 / CIP 104747 / IAM 13177 / JCM 8860 / NBRC 102187 / NCIMB 2189 / SP2) TaxID=797304 RepID=A0A2J4JA81_NATGS|nr:bile acid:sodium symporter family protein [Natronobacterium gregoryi]PLK18307.1 bile acid:sodium symporter family protein [Natronobacterium gregoryi SP2]